VRPVVIGVGTRLGRDDEIGLLLTERLVEDGVLDEADALSLEGADAADVATALLGLRQPVLIADCADMGLSPGTFRGFDDHEAGLHLRADAASTHGLGLADGLALARALGFDQPVRIFAVQPFDLSPAAGMTREMKALLPNLVAAFGAEFRRLVERD
jgi:hydrogenase maturation protease